MVGASSDVFIAKVIEQTGTTTEPYLRTHFSVEVLETIKGNLTGTVTVNQKGGYETGRYETIEGKADLLLVEGDKLLEPGKTYLFVTKGNDERGYTFVPGYGDLLIKDQEGYQNKLARFKNAFAQEIPEKLPETRAQQNQE